MPAFVCSKCGHYGNTALSNWWITDGKDQRCHICLLQDGAAGPINRILWKNRTAFQKAPDNTPKGILL